MQITIPDEYEEAVEKRARELGYQDAEEYLVALLKQEVATQKTAAEVPAEGIEGEDRGWRAVNRLRGTAKGRLSADEIMAMTRSEV